MDIIIFIAGLWVGYWWHKFSTELTTVTDAHNRSGERK